MKTYKVTQEHIDKGQRGQGKTCPVALALLEDYTNPHVGTTTIVCNTLSIIDYYCSSDLHNWIIDFDEDNKVEPFELHLDDKTKVAYCIQD